MVTKTLKTNKSSGQLSTPATGGEKEALEQFRVIFKSVKKHFLWVEQQTGVNGAQLWVLAVIVETPGIKVKELAKALAIHQSTASNLIERLAKQGLIRKERSQDDQRVVHLFPEAQGKILVKRAPKPLQGVLPDALSQMTSSDLVELNRLLIKLVSNMKVHDTSGKSTPLASI